MAYTLRRILPILTVCHLALFSSAFANQNKLFVNINELVVYNFATASSEESPSIYEIKDGEVGLTLEDLMTTAFKYNRMIEVVKQKLAQSRGQLTQARSGYLPQVSLMARYFYTERQDSGASSTVNSGVVSPGFDEVETDDIPHGAANLTQLIYDFGKTSGAIDVGKSNVAAENAHLERQVQEVVFKVKKAYYNVLEKMRLIDVAAESVKSFEQHLGRAQVYYKAGVRTKIDVINAEVELSNARMNLLKSEYNLKTAKVALEQVLGKKPNRGNYVLVSERVDLDTILDTMPPVPITLENSIVEALDLRPDIIQMKKMIEASQANLTRVQGDYWPAITADAKYNEYDTDLSLYKDYWEVGVAATWEIFSGFETKGATAEAKGRLLENKAQLQDLQLTVVSEVTDSYLKTEENRESVQIALQTLDLAKENVQLAEKRYQSGSYDVIEFNDAQLSLTRTQSELIVTYYGYLTAFAGIEFAVGKPLGDEQTN